MDHDPVGQRVLQVDDRLERLVVDDHRADGVGRLVAAVGHDDRDDVAHVARPVDGDREVLRVLHVVGDRPGARHRAPPRRRARSAPVRTASTPGRARASDASMPVMRAWAYGLRTMAEPAGAGDDEVVDVATLAGEERGVLLAHHAGADDGGHDRAPSAAASTAFTMLW